MNSARTKVPLSRGFTLVELLVVIGIIALLISLLLPSLSKAKQQANLTACESNLRGIGLAVINYSVDNHGMLPEKAEDGTGGTADIQDFVNLFQGRDIPVGYNTANNTYTDPGANIGQLIQQGYLGRARMKFTLNPSNNFPPSGGQVDDVMNPNFCPIRFCPAVKNQMTILDAYLAYGSSYLINPNVAPSLVSGYETNWFRRLDQIPPTLALACEFFFASGVPDQGTLRGNMFASLPGPGPIWYPAHLYGLGAGQYAFNILYPDGHVRTAYDKYAYNPVTGGNYGLAKVYSTANRQYMDTLDVLETEADGRDPSRAMALPGYPWVSVNKQFQYPQHSSATPPTQGVPWD
jgi:prepilin-type N-terminal cleavage/methylation domain-containing protein/prepilin-type processing-associated H-X9-DG protein